MRRQADVLTSRSGKVVAVKRNAIRVRVSGRSHLADISLISSYLIYHWPVPIGEPLHDDNKVKLRHEPSDENGGFEFTRSVIGLSRCGENYR